MSAISTNMAVGPYSTDQHGVGEMPGRVQEESGSSNELIMKQLFRHLQEMAAANQRLEKEVLAYRKREAVLRKNLARYQTELQAQQQLSHAQKMEAVGQLAGGMAHELNNQMTIIYACVDLYLSRLPKDDPLRNALLKIRNCAQVSANLTRQLLLFGCRHPNFKIPTDLNHSVQELQQMLKRLIGESITITLEFSENLWPISADAANIDQVIVNLVLNARDAMMEGGAIAIKTENVILDQAHQPGLKPGSYACLSVSDTGAGIDWVNLPHIFEPFFTTKEPGKGSGLGLSVAYGIIQAHDGWIDVASTPGQGSTFKIYLPALLSEAKTPRGASWLSPDEFCGQDERILLVEDDPDVLSLTSRLLTEHGYWVQSCTSAAEAEALFTSQNPPFDLVLTDAVLPDCRGADLVHRLRRLQPSLAALLVSGYTEEHLNIECLQQEQLPFLPKPYTAVELLQRVTGLLEKR